MNHPDYLYLAKGFFLVVAVLLMFYLFFITVSPSAALEVDVDPCITEYREFSASQIIMAASIYRARRTEGMSALSAEALTSGILEVARDQYHCAPTLAEYSTVVRVLDNIHKAVTSFNQIAAPSSVNAYVERAYHAEYVLYSQFGWTALQEGFNAQPR